MTSKRPIRIAIAGGGTGGHVLPAVALIEVLQARGIAAEYLWLGSGEVERRAAERAGIRFAAVQSGKFRRYADPKTVLDVFRVPVGIAQAWRHLRAFRPDVIFSTGGFVSTPSVIAGARIAPILTHEQTTIVGLATRLNARFADVLALSYEQTQERARGLKPRLVVTGNPVRTSLSRGDAARARAQFGFVPDLPLLFLTGGAKGASPLNKLLEPLLPELLEWCQVFHQTGPASANDDAERLRRRREDFPPELRRRYHVAEFVGDELADVFAAATLVLARAGAGTVAELALLGKPAILIPLPLSGGGEQTVNARMLADTGAAVVIAQSDATPERLRSEIASLVHDPTRLADMSTRARSLARPDAADRLADELLALTKQHLRSNVDPQIDE